MLPDIPGIAEWRVLAGHVLDSGERYPLTPRNTAAELPRLTPAGWSPTLESMEVSLTQDQEAFVRQAIESGRFRGTEDAVQEALSLWEERERKRAEFLGTLDDAKASLARGEGRAITQESMHELAEDVKRRGLARLTAEQQVPR